MATASLALSGELGQSRIQSGKTLERRKAASLDEATDSILRRESRLVVHETLNVHVAMKCGFLLALAHL